MTQILFSHITNFQSCWNARYHLSKLAPNIVIIVWQDYLRHEAMQNKTGAMIVLQRPVIYTNLQPCITMRLRGSACRSVSNFHWGLMSDVPVFITSVALCALYWRIQLISLSSLSSPQKINNNYNSGQPDRRRRTRIAPLVTLAKISLDITTILNNNVRSESRKFPPSSKAGCW